MKSDNKRTIAFMTKSCVGAIPIEMIADYIGDQHGDLAVEKVTNRYIHCSASIRQHDLCETLCECVVQHIKNNPHAFDPEHVHEIHNAVTRSTLDIFIDLSVDDEYTTIEPM